MNNSSEIEPNANGLNSTGSSILTSPTTTEADGENQFWLLAHKNLEEWEAAQGIPKILPPKSEAFAHKYLELSHIEIQKLTPEECAEAAVILSQYAQYLSRLVQQEEAKAYWAKEQINRLIFKDIDKINAYMLEERKLKALLGNRAAHNLDKFRVQAETRVKRIAYMAKWVGDVAKSYSTLANMRRKSYD